MNRLPAILFLFLLLITPASAEVVISEFCPDGYASGDGDEYFVISGNGYLDGMFVSDGEGTIKLEGMLNGDLIVARDARAYYSIHSKYPDLEIVNGMSEIPNALVNGRFQMANTADELTLLSNEKVLQTVAWPEDVKSSNGRVHVYNNGVWDERVLKIGQSRFSAENFLADSVTVFVSPDSSYNEVINFIDSARDELIISIYEFTSADIAHAVNRAVDRGVRVKILAEGGPVGGMPEEEKGVLNYLSNAGADVYTIESASKLPARYRYLHNKYAVCDGYRTLITSENFKDSGIPKTGSRGNRGWGIIVSDTETAEYFTNVFESDLAGYDIVGYEPGDEVMKEGGVYESAYGLYGSKTVHNVAVTPVISPDTSYLIKDLITSSSKSLDVQQAYISKYPGGEENEWLDAVIDAAQRGVNVRVILDGMYYNTQDDADNDELVARLNRMNLQNLRARLMNPDKNIIKLHNKGLISDGRYVLVSSVNWNYNSPNNNREAGIIVESEEIAKYFTEVFDYDFGGVKTDPISAKAGFDLRIPLACAIPLLFALVFVIVRIKNKNKR